MVLEEKHTKQPKWKQDAVKLLFLRSGLRGLRVGLEPCKVGFDDLNQRRPYAKIRALLRVLCASRDIP
jgi:hypothetical protein